MRTADIHPTDAISMAALWGQRAALNIDDAVRADSRDHEARAYECAIMAAHVARPVAELMEYDDLALDKIAQREGCAIYTRANWIGLPDLRWYCLVMMDRAGARWYRATTANGRILDMRIAPSAYGGAFVTYHPWSGGQYSSMSAALEAALAS